MVYVITDGTAVKIGTGDVERRIKQLQCGNPRELRPVCTIELPFGDGCQLERALHRYYANYRIRGEWFSLDVVPHITSQNEKFFWDMISEEPLDSFLTFLKNLEGGVICPRRALPKT